MLSSFHKGGYQQRGLALSVWVGVMLSLFVTPVAAQTDSLPALNVPESHFAWYAHAELDANYIWRGLYCGGLSLQAEAEVSYFGFYANMWWNVGTTNWKWGRKDPLGHSLTGINPEVDVSLGYRYKGFKVLFMQMYYFDRYADGKMSRFFDYRNFASGGGGVTTEWRIGYRISDRVPLSLLWCTRTFGRDGYLVGGELKRAYSTYIEARYDQPLPLDMTLTALIGVTPWRSLYTGFQKQFAVVNLLVGLNKSWQIDQHCSMNLGGVIVLNPSSMEPLWNISAGVTWN